MLTRNAMIVCLRRMVDWKHVTLYYNDLTTRQSYTNDGWKWCGLRFRNNGDYITEFDVFPKPKKCKTRDEFVDFLKTFDDWDHVKRFMKDPSNNHWGWGWCGDYVRKHGCGVITERDVFPEDWAKDLSDKPVCTGIVKQFKPNHPIDNNLPEIVRTTSGDVLVPCSTKWVSGL